MGPETYNNVGNEIHLTNNRIVKSQADLGISAYLLMNKFNLLGKKEKIF